MSDHVSHKVLDHLVYDMLDHLLHEMSDHVSHRVLDHSVAYDMLDHLSHVISCHLSPDVLDHSAYDMLEHLSHEMSDHLSRKVLDHLAYKLLDQLSHSMLYHLTRNSIWTSSLWKSSKILVKSAKASEVPLECTWITKDAQSVKVKCGPHNMLGYLLHACHITCHNWHAVQVLYLENSLPCQSHQLQMCRQALCNMLLESFH